MYMPAVVMTTAASPGQANGDGKVDINDLTIVPPHFGQTGMTWSQGEFTGDGKVDINDLTIVLSNFGKSSLLWPGGMAGVPEPGTLALIAAGLVGLLAWAKPLLGHQSRLPIAVGSTKSPLLTADVVSAITWLAAIPAFQSFDEACCSTAFKLNGR